MIKAVTMVRCCVPYCDEKRDGKHECHFFKFPTEVSLRQKWIDAIPLKNFKPTTRTHVCEKHFLPRDIKITMGKNNSNGAPTLANNAIPTIINIPQPEKEEHTCLACLKKGCFTIVYQAYIHNRREIDFSQMLSDCFCLQVNNVKGQPRNPYYICDKCICNLRSAYDFKKQIELSQLRFKEMFNKAALVRKLFVKRPFPLPLNIKIERDETENPKDVDALPHKETQKSSHHIDLFPKSSFSPNVQNNKDKIYKKCGNISCSGCSICNAIDAFDSTRLESIASPISVRNKLEILEIFSKEEECNNENSQEDVEPGISEKQEDFSWMNDSDFRWEENEEEDSDAFERIKMKKYASDIPGILACSECTYTTDTMTELQKHLGQHFALEKPFLCEVCGLTYSASRNLYAHKMTHAPSKSFTCELCSKSYRTSSELNRHIKIHLGIKPYICEVCGKSFTRMSYLKQHQSIHKNQKRICKNYLRRTDSELWLKCTDCDIDFNSVVEFQTHRVTEHIKDKNIVIYRTADESPRMHACGSCDKAFKSLQALKNHSVSHSELKPFLCVVCNRGFKRKSDLEGHLVCHSTEKPYECKKCLRKYARINDFRHHYLTHHNRPRPRPFPCSLCSLRFIRRGELKRHLITHSQDKPFTCEICNFKCKRLNDLKSHVVVHTGKRLSCPFCKFTSLHQRYLRRHLLTHEKIEVPETEMAKSNESS